MPSPVAIHEPESAPLPLADIAGGYDASVIDNVRFPFPTPPASGNPIDVWYDTFSGAFRDFTQGTIAQRPTWVANIQNGLGAVQFDSGLQQFMDRPAIITGADPGAIYIVMRTLDPAGANSGWMRFGSDGFQEDHCTNNPGDGVYSGFGSTARKTLSTVGNAVVRTWHLAELHSNASEFSYYRNGGLVFTTGTNTVGWNATCQLAKSITLYWGGYMGQVVAYDTIHDAATRARAALNAKWNLY
jgi:hypothetical protein